MLHGTEEMIRLKSSLLNVFHETAVAMDRPGKRFKAAVSKVFKSAFQQMLGGEDADFIRIGQNGRDFRMDQSREVTMGIFRDRKSSIRPGSRTMMPSALIFFNSDMRIWDCPSFP
jgi:23S rRNA G2069 N7-methylase RlmK/C1962 C5-methylase RlmI